MSRFGRTSVHQSQFFARCDDPETRRTEGCPRKLVGGAQAAAHELVWRKRKNGHAPYLQKVCMCVCVSHGRFVATSAAQRRALNPEVIGAMGPTHFEQLRGLPQPYIFEPMLGLPGPQMSSRGLDLRGVVVPSLRPRPRPLVSRRGCVRTDILHARRAPSMPSPRTTLAPRRKHSKPCVGAARTKLKLTSMGASHPTHVHVGRRPVYNI